MSAWLAARSHSWRERIEVVAIDPSAAFRRALREQRPHAAVSVDAFYGDLLVMPRLGPSGLVARVSAVRRSA